MIVCVSLLMKVVNLVLIKYVKDDVEKCDINNQHLDITYIGEEIKDEKDDS